MNRRVRLVLAVAGTLAAGAAVTWWLWPSVKRPDRQQSRDAGGAMAGALAAAMDQAEHRLAALDCAVLEPAPAAGPRDLPATARRFSVRGDTLSAAGDGALVIAVVADARGGTPPTLARIERLRAELAAAGVELVVSLGGQGTARADLQAVLGGLAAGPWALLAIPGDRESLAEHAAAVAALGGAVVDGGRVRFVDAAGVTIATFPGAEGTA
ncbi:MAG TPA: hypothetical protein VL172_06050, partial [Kofleriaceae bacterium]|nr:hypothetical protein [Kofleriaceae bacterium]